MFAPKLESSITEVLFFYATMNYVALEISVKNMQIDLNQGA